ncbi:hypothetical protein [Nocardia panacis]|nr:hypothetical protein [Nocardia panacis]
MTPPSDAPRTHAGSVAEQTDPRGLLRLRLAAAGGPAVHRMVAPGLVEVLTLAPLGRAVTPELLAEWEIGVEEALASAEANSGAESLELGWEGRGETDLAVLTGSEFAGAHIRRLEHYPVIGQHGALFVAAGAGELYAHPLCGPDSEVVLDALGTIACSAAITSSVFWWQDRVIRLAATTATRADGSVEVRPTPELRSVLDGLTATHEFALLPADIDGALEALEIYSRLRTDPGRPDPALRALSIDLDPAYGLTAGAGGAILHARGHDRAHHLLAALNLTKDRDLAVLDIATGCLYNPRERVEVEVTMPDHTLPYLTPALLADLITAAADPNDPDLTLTRAGDRIRAHRHEYVYQLETRTGTECSRVYTVLPVVVREVLWAWACEDPDWKTAVGWRKVAPGAPGVESARGLEILQDELAAPTSRLTVEGLALLDQFLGLRDRALPAGE